MVLSTRYLAISADIATHTANKTTGRASSRVPTFKRGLKRYHANPGIKKLYRRWANKAERFAAQSLLRADQEPHHDH